MKRGHFIPHVSLWLHLSASYVSINIPVEIEKYQQEHLSPSPSQRSLKPAQFPYVTPFA